MSILIAWNNKTKRHKASRTVHLIKEWITKNIINNKNLSINVVEIGKKVFITYVVLSNQTSPKISLKLREYWQINICIRTYTSIRMQLIKRCNSYKTKLSFKKLSQIMVQKGRIFTTNWEQNELRIQQIIDENFIYLNDIQVSFHFFYQYINNNIMIFWSFHNKYMCQHIHVLIICSWYIYQGLTKMYYL